MPGVRFLNKAKVLEKLRDLAQKAKNADANIKQVILFGSLATDTYTALSDADLLIILRESDQRFIDRIPYFLLLFMEAPLPVEVFPYREDEVIHAPLAQQALSQGVVLA